MKLILASECDPAAMNIMARLLELYDFEKTATGQHSYFHEGVALATIPEESTKLDVLPSSTEEVIFASRHASEVGKPSLTVHVPGKLKKKELALASPRTIKSALIALKTERDSLELPYEVSLEATHHGPTRLNVPVTFVEIGSRLEQWVDRKAGEVAAHAIMKAAISHVSCENAVGLGGPHYAPRHTEITFQTGVGIGHVIPKYVKFDENLVELAVRRTHDGAQLLALDWKGLDGGQRETCQKVAEILKIRAVRTKEIALRKKL